MFIHFRYHQRKFVIQVRQSHSVSILVNMLEMRQLSGCPNGKATCEGQIEERSVEFLQDHLMFRDLLLGLVKR